MIYTPIPINNLLALHKQYSTQTAQIIHLVTKWGICIKACFLLEIYSKTLHLEDLRLKINI